MRMLELLELECKVKGVLRVNAMPKVPRPLLWFLLLHLAQSSAEQSSAAAASSPFFTILRRLSFFCGRHATF